MILKNYALLSQVAIIFGFPVLWRDGSVNLKLLSSLFIFIRTFEQAHFLHEILKLIYPQPELLFSRMYRHCKARNEFCETTWSKLKSTKFYESYEFFKLFLFGTSAIFGDKVTKIVYPQSAVFSCMYLPSMWSLYKYRTLQGDVLKIYHISD